MRLRFDSAHRRLLLAAAVAFLLYALGPAGAVPAQQVSRSGRAANKALSRMMIPGTEDLQLIIELTEPSVVERLRMDESQGSSAIPRRLSERGRPMDFASPRALTYRQGIGRAQQSLESRILELPDAEIQGTTDIAMNAVIVRVHASHIGAIRRLPGVRKVYFSRPQRMLLDQSAIIQNAQVLWTAAGGRGQAGHGVRIGIIDSGIDITNPMFIDDSLVPPAGFPKADNQADLAFTNKKVIVARNYISLLSNPQSVQTAIDEVGHGTFVAGVAAGKQVAAPLATISGMAPGAFLGSYKVFGTPGVNDSVPTAAILAALNDALADGMNVINLSLGALDYIPPSEDPEVTALENAVQAGVVVTISAGNDGPMPHSIGSPGVAPDAITVGSVTNSRSFVAVLHATSPTPVPSNLSTIVYSSSADGPRVTSNIPSTGIVDVMSLDGNGLACSTLASASLSGRIALVERGTCNFSVKVANSALAGAMAVIVYNNDPEGGIISMIQLSATSIPAVMISYSDGVALKQFVDANSGSAQVAIDNSQTLQAVPATARVISSFSSVGPGTDFSIKPDMVAVGENVYSAAESTSSTGELYDASKFSLASGTSFSAPMVAGAAAGLRELFPSLGALAIKSLLTSTASRSLTVDGTSPPNIVKAGSGLLDMGGASAARAVFSPTSLNFGVHSYSGSLSLSTTLNIQNISANSDQFSLGVQPIVAGPTISFRQNNTGSVAPGATASVVVSLQVAAPLSGGFQGFITIQDSSNSYRIPYWAGLYVPDSTRVLPVSLNTSSAGTYGSLAAALAAARPGNVIEFQDSSSYDVGSGGLVISTNSEGLPLHGITIRAAAGQSPVIGGSRLGSSGSPANIHIVGLQNVLLQGLTINGGYTGIELSQPSATVPLSVTIDHCIISNSVGDLFATGILIDGGGTVDITQSNLSGSSGTGILAGIFANGTQLTLLGTTVQGNGNDGLDAYGSNVDILNSTFSGNQGAGLYLDYSMGTVDGNTIAQSRTFINRGRSSYGDGIQIADGNVVLRNNVFDSNDEAGVALFRGDGTGLGPVVQITGNTMRKNGFYGVYSAPSPSALMDSNLIENNSGGVHLDGGSAVLLNNIIVKSTDASLGNGIEIAGGGNVRVVNNTVYQNNLRGVVLTSGSISLVNSIVYANTQGDLQGVGSGSVQSSLVSVNPNFVNPGSDDFSLAPGSPAIDAGSNSSTDLPFLDYNRRLRVASPSASFLPGQGTVDIGAEEANSAYPLVFPLVVNGSEPALGGSFTTGVAVMNPTSQTAQVSFTANNGDGSALAASANPAVRSLAPEAQLPTLSWQLFGFDWTRPVLGSVLGTSASKVAGFFLVFDPSFSHFSSGANVSDQTGRDLVFMRHEFDSSGKAVYVIGNPGAGSAKVTATLHDSTGQSIGAAQTATIAAKGQVVLGFNSVTLSSGYVRVQSDRPVSGLEAIGNNNFLSALGGFSPGSDARLFFPHYAVGGNFSTQVGIVNSAASQADLTLSAYDDNGNEIGGPVSITLPAGGQLLKAVTDLFSIGTASLQTGYIVAQGDQPGIMGFTNFTYNDGIHNSTAAVPADSVPRPHLLFSHVANLLPYQTGIALLNPFGTPLGYTISVFDGGGTMVSQASYTLLPHQKVARYLSQIFNQSLSFNGGHVEVSTDYGLIGFELFYTENFSQLASVPAQVNN